MIPHLNPQTLLSKIQTQMEFTVGWVRVRLGLEPLGSAQSTNRTRANSTGRVYQPLVSDRTATIAYPFANPFLSQPLDQNRTAPLRRPPLDLILARVRRPPWQREKRAVQRPVPSSSSQRLCAHLMPVVLLPRKSSSQLLPSLSLLSGLARAPEASLPLLLCFSPLLKLPAFILGFLYALLSLS